MNYQELMTKYNAEEIGDRLIAVVNGQRQYIADKTDGGGFILTNHGEMLVGADEAQAEVEAEEKPKRRKKAEEPAAGDDLLAGLDSAAE